MVIKDLQNYWSLVQAHRRLGKDSSLQGLRLLARGAGKAAHMAQLYLLNHDHKEKTAIP